MGEVGPAVDEEYCCARWGGGLREEVMVVDAVEEDKLVLDAGVGGREFFRSHCGLVGLWAGFRGKNDNENGYEEWL